MVLGLIEVVSSEDSKLVVFQRDHLNFNDVDYLMSAGSPKINHNFYQHQNKLSVQNNTIHPSICPLRLKPLSAGIMMMIRQYKMAVNISIIPQHSRWCLWAYAFISDQAETPIMPTCQLLFVISAAMAAGKGLISPKQFLATSIKLAKEACRIVEQSYMNKSVKQFYKSANDPVTEADYKIQSMVIKGVKMHFPALRIVGEEDKDYDGDIDTQFDKLGSLVLPQLFNGLPDLELAKCCLWIDPIDNTKGFIGNEIEAVTNLIGLSYDKKAQIGIIGIPFRKSSGTAEYSPSILVGSVSEKVAYQYSVGSGKWARLLNDRPLIPKPRIAMSPFRENKVEKIIMERLKCQPILAGGSGYKMALVARQQAQLMAYNLSYSQKWDTCAGEAIIRAMGGYCTTQFGEDLCYDPAKPKEYNTDGVICSLNKQLHGRSVEISTEYRNSQV